MTTDRATSTTSRRPPYLSLVPRHIPIAPPRVVLLEDDAVMLGALERLLVREGFVVIASHDPQEAVRAVLATSPDAIVSDLFMPALGGNVVLSLLAHAAPNTARVLLTSNEDVWCGAPFSVDAIVSKRDAGATLSNVLREVVSERARQTFSNGVRALAKSVVRALTPEDLPHCERVAAWASILARAHGLTATQVATVELGAILHDVGNVGTRSDIKTNAGVLSEDQWREVRRHPTIGAALLHDMPTLRLAIPVVIAHHERWDGTGYPEHLGENAIPIEARVFQIVDAYDAITSCRSDRGARSGEDARGEIAAGAGGQFDPNVHATFAAISSSDWDAAVAHLRTP